MNKINKKTVVAIGGVDSSGGAGLFTDSLAIRSGGFHCAPVPVLNTVQSGLVFKGIIEIESAVFLEQLKLIFESQNVAAIKTGALGGSNTVNALVEFIEKLLIKIPVIADPVLGSSTGGELANENAVASIKNRLFPLCEVVTPNISEASVLCGFDVFDLKTMEFAGRRILAMGAKNVLVKGGHLNIGARQRDIFDVLVTESGDSHILKGRVVDISEIRGTGCALASLIAANRALGFTVLKSVEMAREKLADAMENSYSAGDGPGILGF
ncbi:MAG: hydroxymethylpyrimidine/phosphomethylpyrimidine kinase [Deltaproteobacteria bacterium]|nr:hydroxymethylpyrimidine/phosphomethylpyrimidine kinase [Deltaproteobacteria bacterium]